MITQGPAIDTAHSASDHSGSDASGDTGEDPESPGGRLPAAPLAREAEVSGDPLAEPIAALLGGALAIVTLLVPILTVVTSPVESSSRFRHSPATPALSRSRAIEAGPAASLAP